MSIAAQFLKLQPTNQSPQKSQVPTEPLLQKPVDDSRLQTLKTNSSQFRLEEINIRLGEIDIEIATISDELIDLDTKISNLSKILENLPGGERGFIMKNVLTNQLEQLKCRKGLLESKLDILEKEQSNLIKEHDSLQSELNTETVNPQYSTTIAGVIFAKQEQAKAEIARIEKREAEIEKELELLEAKENADRNTLTIINKKMERIERIIEQYETNPRQVLRVMVLKEEYKNLGIEAEDLEAKLAAIDEKKYLLQLESDDLQKTKEQWESQLFI